MKKWICKTAKHLFFICGKNTIRVVDGCWEVWIYLIRVHRGFEFDVLFPAESAEVVLRTLELLPVNVALRAFIRIPWARIVARPVLQTGQLWAWVPSPSLNASAQLASLKLGPWMLVAALEAHNKPPIIGIFLEGFSFTSGALEVWIVFAQRCFHDHNRPHHVRSEVSNHHWAALAKCDQDDVSDDVLEVDFLSNNLFLLRFNASAFRVAGAIL